MSDPRLVHRILANIAMAIRRIERRFAGIERAEDFWISDVCQNKIGGLKRAIDALLTEYPGA